MAKSSFIERNKAVREAWIKEQNLVQEGKGTRAWTPEQQKDILEKGKAYDDSGKAIEGQHMKSAEQYPEYQGDPGNIQFLTRAEHLEAHNGNWQNPEFFLALWQAWAALVPAPNADGLLKSVPPGRWGISPHLQRSHLEVPPGQHPAPAC